MWIVLGEKYLMDDRYVARVKCPFCGAEKVLRTKAIRPDTKCGICRTIARNKSHFGKHKGVGDLSRTFFNYFKYTAKRRSIEFLVTIEELWGLFEQQGGKCALSGIPLKFPIGNGYGGANTTIESPSLDRIDSTKPYVVGNVQWLHKHINIMKNAFGQVEFIALCHAVANQHANQQPSPMKEILHRWHGGRPKKESPSRSVWSTKVVGKVQSATSEDSLPINSTRAPDSCDEQDDDMHRHSDESRRA